MEAARGDCTDRPVQFGNPTPRHPTRSGRGTDCQGLPSHRCPGQPMVSIQPKAGRTSPQPGVAALPWHRLRPRSLLRSTPPSIGRVFGPRETPQRSKAKAPGYRVQFRNRRDTASLSAGVQKETCCGSKMRLVQSENLPSTSDQRFSGGLGGVETTQNWRPGWWMTVTV